MKDLYIIRKFVRASNAKEALDKDKTAEVNEVYIDNDWLKCKVEKLVDKEIYRH